MTKLLSDLTKLLSDLGNPFDYLDVVVYRHTTWEKIRYLFFGTLALYRFMAHVLLGTPGVPQPFSFIYPFNMPYWPLGSISVVGWLFVMFVLLAVHVYSFWVLHKNRGRVSNSLFLDATMLSVFWSTWLMLILMCFVNITEVISINIQKLG